MQQLRRFIDRWLFEEYRSPPESLAIFRILFATYALLAELPNGLWSGPRVAFAPPVSFAAFFTEPPSHAVMLVLNAVAMLCTGSLLIGFRTAASSVGMGLGLILVNSFAYADGKIDEGLLIWVALLMAGSGWGAAFSVDERRLRRSGRDAPAAAPWALPSLVMVIGFALFTAGSAKARGGWLHLDTFGTRYHLFWDYYVFGRQTPLATWAFGNLPAWGWKIADLSTVIWEMGFVLTVFRREWCRIACAYGVLFHFGAWQLFDILIASNAVAYGVVIDWTRVLPRGTRWLRTTLDGASTGTLTAVCAVPFVFAACALFLFSAELRETLWHWVTKIVLSGALLGALGYLALRLRRVFTSSSSSVARP